MKKNAYYYLRSNSSVIKHSGSDSLDLLNRLTTNDLSNLNKLNPIRTLLTNNKGRIVDSLLILMRNDNDLYLLSDSNDQSKIINEIEKYTIIEDSILSDISKNISRLILYGKDIKSFLQNVHTSYFATKYNEKHCGKLETSTVADLENVVIKPLKHNLWAQCARQKFNSIKNS